MLKFQISLLILAMLSYGVMPALADDGGFGSVRFSQTAPNALSDTVLADVTVLNQIETAAGDETKGLNNSEKDKQLEDALKAQDQDNKD
jgi:hypothetical protein